eukprot:3113589-Rhodomonas_salina.1
MFFAFLLCSCLPIRDPLRVHPTTSEECWGKLHLMTVRWDSRSSCLSESGRRATAWSRRCST